jgi:ABC-type glycerol-3-phosphate transport system substrate-binding protein
MRKFARLFLVIILAALLLGACAAQTTAPATTSASSNTSAVADGKTLLDTRCTACHSTAKVVTQHLTSDQWKQVVDNMISKGATLSADEETVLVQYLADNFK